MPQATNRYDQIRTLRNGNGTGFTSIVSDRVAEDWVTAYRVERQRIAREREDEIRQQLEEPDIWKKLQNDPVELLKDLVPNLVENRVTRILPGLEPIVTVLQQATERQAQVQDLLAPTIKEDSCGISVITPFIRYHQINPDCLPEGAKAKPFEMPSAFFPTGRGLQWASFANENVGKTFTLAWNYTGWVRTLYYSVGSNLGIGALEHQNTFFPYPDNNPRGYDQVGAIIPQAMHFTAVNPAATQQASVAVGFSSNIGSSIAFSTHGNFVGGYDSAVPTPQASQALYSYEEDVFNYYSPPNIRKNGFRGIAKLLAKSTFNLGDGRATMCFLVSINYRCDISITGGVEPWMIYNANALRWQNISTDAFAACLVRTFEAPISQGSGISSLIASPAFIDFPAPEARIKPPPPPPNKRCDCMPNCCPQSQFDTAQLKRMLRQVIAKQIEQDRKIGLDKLPFEIPGSNELHKSLKAAAKNNPVTNFFFNNQIVDNLIKFTGVLPGIKFNSLLEAVTFGFNSPGGSSDNSDLEKLIGKPKKVKLWDTDFSKPGEQSKDIEPKSLFEWFTTLSDRVEIALRIIGIHDLPISVDSSLSDYTDLKKMFSASPNKNMQKLAKELGDKKRRTITSVFQYIDWLSDTTQETMGKFESKVNFDDVDLIRDGSQSKELVHANISHALHDVTKFSGSGAIHAEANTWLISDVLMELAVLKQEIMRQSYAQTALIDYLGFGYKEVKQDIPIPVTFDPKLLKDRNLPGFLKDSNVSIQKIVLKEKEASLSLRLQEIENVLGILKAVNLVPVKSAKDIIDLLTRLNKDDEWNDFIKLQEQFIKENELPFKIDSLPLEQGDKP